MSYSCKQFSLFLFFIFFFYCAGSRKEISKRRWNFLLDKLFIHYIYLNTQNHMPNKISRLIIMSNCVDIKQVPKGVMYNK